MTWEDLLRVPTEGQKSTQRRRSDDRSRGPAQKGIASSRAVYERKGFIDTKVSYIVAEAGVAHGTFYTYFDTKESIFKSVSYALVDEMLAALAVPVAADEFHDRAHDAVRRYSTPSGRRRHFWR